MAIFRLHLNGGPRDDQYLDHWVSSFEVGAIRGGLTTITEAIEPMPMQTGRYELRLDANGDPVPHNLEGFVEADWKGWD